MKNFFQAVVNDFNDRSLFASTGVRVAAISYTRNSQIEFGFKSTYNDTTNGVSGIDLEGRNGGTFLYKALNLAVDTFQQTQATRAPVILVILTDGQTHVPETYPDALEDAIEKIDDTTIIRTVFEIGEVGNQKVLDLKKIASSPSVNHLHRLQCTTSVGSKSALDQLAASVWTNIQALSDRCSCTNPTTPTTITRANPMMPTTRTSPARSIAPMCTIDFENANCKISIENRQSYSQYCNASGAQPTIMEMYVQANCLRLCGRCDGDPTGNSSLVVLTSQVLTNNGDHQPSALASHACPGDRLCKLCTENGQCQRCQHGAYLLRGRCEQDANACAAAGLVAVGTGGSKYGRACIKVGEVCKLNSHHSCRSPKALGDCTASIVTSANLTCIECDIGSWLLNGVCKKQLYCGRNNKFAETGERCSCNRVSANSAVIKTCKRCNARKVAASAGMFYPNPKGLMVECTSCKSPHLMHNDQCIIRADCPLSMTQYSVGSAGGRCEKPFACVLGKREGGDRDGNHCKCTHRDVCRNCIWNAARATQQCTLCKKFMLLHNGRCIDEMECIKKGLIPVRADGPQGGRCLKSTEAGTDE